MQTAMIMGASYANWLADQGNVVADAAAGRRPQPFARHRGD